MTFVISVIMPVHGAGGYLARTLENLRAISGEGVEFVAIDDHSADDSLEVLRSWVGELPNLTVLESEDRGVAAARNQAVRAASGTYLWFTDCDDDWDPQIVGTMLNAARRDGADVVVSNATKVALPSRSSSEIVDATEAEVMSGGEALTRLLTGRIQGHLWNKLFARRLFDEIHFPSTRAHSDLGAMFALLGSAERVTLVPETLYTYYVHDGSILNQRQYRWDDLWDCLTLAGQAVSACQEGGSIDSGALVTFKYRNVIIPSINETVRRESTAAAQDIRDVRARARAAISVSELVRLLTQLGQADAAIRGAMIKFAFPLYRVIYRRHRRRTWSEVDTLS